MQFNLAICCFAFFLLFLCCYLSLLILWMWMENSTLTSLQKAEIEKKIAEATQLNDGTVAFGSRSASATATENDANAYDPAIKREELWKTKVHFGHLVNHWNPKMKKYIFGTRYKLHIINLKQTTINLNQACQFFYQLGAENKKILFVGTKPQAQWAVATAARLTMNYFVNARWLGGTLTNSATIKKNIKRLWELEKGFKTGAFNWLNKKERLDLERKKIKLENTFQGIKNMNRLPDALLVVNPDWEETALKEARKLNIPRVGICDTNCDPSLLNYCIPANDDTVEAIYVILKYLITSYCTGAQLQVPPLPEIPATASAQNAPLYLPRYFKGNIHGLKMELIVPLYANKAQYLKDKMQKRLIKTKQDGQVVFFHHKKATQVVYKPGQRIFKYQAREPIIWQGSRTPGRTARNLQPPSSLLTRGQRMPQVNHQLFREIKIVNNDLRASLMQLRLLDLKTLAKKINLSDQLEGRLLKSRLVDLLATGLKITNNIICTK